MKRLKGGVSRALGGSSKAVLFSLSVKIDAVRVPDPAASAADELVIVELERGRHRSETEPVAAGAAHAAWQALPPLVVPVTLFRDAKGNYRGKLFTLRLKRANDRKAPPLATMAALDAADLAVGDASHPPPYQWTTLKLDDADAAPKASQIGRASSSDRSGSIRTAGMTVRVCCAFERDGARNVSVSRGSSSSSATADDAAKSSSHVDESQQSLDELGEDYEDGEEGGERSANGSALLDAALLEQLLNRGPDVDEEQVQAELLAAALTSKAGEEDEDGENNVGGDGDQNRSIHTLTASLSGHSSGSFEPSNERRASSSQTSSSSTDSSPRAGSDTRVKRHVLGGKRAAAAAAAAAAAGSSDSSRGGVSNSYERGGSGGRSSGGRLSASPSPFRQAAVAEELARQLRVARSERDDALAQVAAMKRSGLKGTEVADEEAAAAARLLAQEKARAEAAELRAATAEGARASAQAEAQQMKATAESLEEQLRSAARASAKAVARAEAEGERAREAELRAEAAEARAKASDSEDHASSRKSCGAGSNSNSERDDELVKALRAQLAMTQDLVASTRAELDSQAKEQNDLRETAAAAAGAARHATGRAQTAEARIQELEASLLELEATSGQASEESEMREGALKAMAQYRLKELEEELAAEKACREEYEKEKEAREAREKEEKEAAQLNANQSQAAASLSSAAQKKAIEAAQSAARASAEARATAEARAETAEANLQEANEKLSSLKNGMASVEAHVLRLEASAEQANESSARERRAIDALRAAKRQVKNVQKRLKAASAAAGIDLPPLPPPAAKKTSPEQGSQEEDHEKNSSGDDGEVEAALIQSLVEELGRRQRVKADLQQELIEAQNSLAETQAKLQASEEKASHAAAAEAAAASTNATANTAETAATTARVSELEARCARALSECAEAKRRETVATRTAVDALRGIEAQHAKDIADLKEELSQRAEPNGIAGGAATAAVGDHDATMVQSMPLRDAAVVIWARLRSLSEQDPASAKELLESLDARDFTACLEAAGLATSDNHAVLVTKVAQLEEIVGQLTEERQELEQSYAEALKTQVRSAFKEQKNTDLSKEMEELKKAFAEATTELQTAKAAAAKAAAVLASHSGDDALAKAQKEREEAVKLMKEAAKREKELGAKEAALQYDKLRAQDKEQEMLSLVVQAKLNYAQSKEQVDSLKRDNARLGSLVSDVKGQLANAKAVQEDIEATCQHALADRAEALRELESLKSKNSRSSSFFSRS